MVSGNLQRDTALNSVQSAAQSAEILSRHRGDSAAALADLQAAAALAPDNVWLLKDIGHALRELGRLDEAYAAFAEAVAIAPELFEGHRGLGLVAQLRRDFTAALSHFQAAAALAPDNVWLFNDIGHTLRELGRPDEAEAAYLDVATLAPQLFDGPRGLGLVARQRGDLAGALRHFEAAAALAPDNVRLIVDVGDVARELGRLGEAEAAYARATTLAPELFDGPRGLGLIAQQRGDCVAALAHFQAASALAPDNVWLFNDIGHTLRELGRLDEAEAAYMRVAAMAPQLLDGPRGLGLVAQQRGDFAAALAHFQAAAALAPDNVWLVNDIGHALRELGRLDEAEAAYARVVAMAPQLFDGPRGLGLVARQRGDLPATVLHFEAAAVLAPDNVWVLDDLAAGLCALMRHDEAETRLMAFMTRHPESPQAMLAYAQCLRRKAPAAEVLEWLTKAAAIETTDLSAKLTLANEYLSKWDLESAERLYDRIGATAPGNPWVLIGKGHIARMRGDRDRALDLYAQAAKTEAFESATMNYAAELSDAGRYKEADDSLASAIARRPASSALHVARGRTAKAAGDFPAAAAAFAEAERLDPRQEDAQIELAIDELRQGRSAAAVERLNRIAAQRPNRARAFETLAHFAEQFDDLETAANHLRRAAEIEPSDLGVRLRLADILAKSGQTAEADQTLESCAGKFGALPQISIISAGLMRDRGDYARSREILAKARREFPTNFEIWFHYVTSLVACGAFDDVRMALDAAPACSALEMARVHQLRGELAAAEWKFDEACAFYDEGLKPNPHDSWLNDRAAFAAMLAVDPARAQRHLEEAVRSNFQHRLTHNGAWKPSQTHLGQLLDEYKIDRIALEQLRKAKAAPDRLGELAKLVLDLPDYTPAAMTFLIAARRSGFFPPLTASASDRPCVVPLGITQYWDKEIPEDVRALCDQWRDMHRDFSYMLFTKQDARKFLLEMGPRDAVAAFDRAIEPAMQADIFRLVYLYHRGGFYIDADDRCLAPLPLEAFGDYDLILYQEDFATVGNNFIGVRAHHPAIGLAMTNAIAAVNRGDSDMLWLSTGPGLLTRSLATYLAEQWPERVGKVLIMERHELFRIAALHTRTAYKLSQKHWTRTTFQRSSARMASKTPIAASQLAKPQP